MTQRPETSPPPNTGAFQKALPAPLTINEAQPQPGKVFLIGAGPGDPDLLTIKALRILQSADVVLTDALVSDGIRDLIAADAEIINVGKAKGRHSKTQAEINTLIVRIARQGRTVVRLKGGDPFVFGRGGEEVDILRASGIACEVVPGITAATAAAASLQIPLTHRDLGRTVTFMSGHPPGGGTPDFGRLDFKALAVSRSTLVVYMGVSTAGCLGQTLIKNSWSPATPVMAVENASRAGERRVATTLDVLAAEPETLRLSGPAVLLIGEVAGLTADGIVERGAATADRVARRDRSAFSVVMEEMSHA